MPNDKKTKDCCIICGRESRTVVCMRCYFNFDYRTYNEHELEQTTLSFSSEEENLEQKDDSFLSDWEKEFEQADIYVESDDIEVFDDEPESEEG